MGGTEHHMHAAFEKGSGLRGSATNADVHHSCAHVPIPPPPRHATPRPPFPRLKGPSRAAPPLLGRHRRSFSFCLSCSLFSNLDRLCTSTMCVAVCRRERLMRELLRAVPPPPLPPFSPSPSPASPPWHRSLSICLFVCPPPRLRFPLAHHPAPGARKDASAGAPSIPRRQIAACVSVYVDLCYFLFYFCAFCLPSLALCSRGT